MRSTCGMAAAATSCGNASWRRAVLSISGLLDRATFAASKVDLDKDAEFLGREALRRVRAEGVKRRLVGVEIGGAPIEFNMTRWPVHKGSENIGQVTSAIYSPRLEKNIGYAMVPVAHAARCATWLVISGW